MPSTSIALSTEMHIPSTAPAPLWSGSAVVIADELNLRFAHAQFYLMPTKGSLWGGQTRGVAIGGLGWNPALGSTYMQSFEIFFPPLCLYLAGSEVTLFFLK